MIVTTTGTVDGYRIVRYYPPIVANLVVGTGLFSDMVAGFSDVFGGRSETYQRQLADMYSQAVQELTLKATQVGANCAVGARFDLGEISGKGMQMFMLSAVATPVVIKTDAELAHEAEVAAQEQAVRERERAILEQEQAERRERFQGIAPVMALLADPRIAKEARDVRRIYGRAVCVSFFKRKALELGFGEIHLTEDDLPDPM